MFSVIFEVHPGEGQTDAYLGNAKMLRPELEAVEGFVDNVRYKSLTRDGWILSLSGWRDEKAVVRWRTKMRHHEVQQKGRDAILEDYHLRVGEIVGDTRIPEGEQLLQQRTDETVVGEAKYVTLVTAKRPTEWPETKNPYDCAEWLGFNPYCRGCVTWDIFEAVLTPGDLALMVTWSDAEAAEDAEAGIYTKGDSRIRRVRVIRDYSKYDRREAPQYYPDAAGRETLSN